MMPYYIEACLLRSPYLGIFYTANSMRVFLVLRSSIHHSILTSVHNTHVRIQTTILGLSYTNLRFDFCVGNPRIVPVLINPL